MLRTNSVTEVRAGAYLEQSGTQRELMPTRPGQKSAGDEAAEQIWRTTLANAARSWHSGAHRTSILLQSEGITHADRLMVQWPLLWSTIQLGVCHAMADECEPATMHLRQAVSLATSRGQPVIAGMCVTLEALCTEGLTQAQLGSVTRQQVCDLYRGLIQYAHINGFPFSEACWLIDQPPAQVKPPSAGGLHGRTETLPGLRVFCLGHFGVHIDGRPLTNLPAGRSTALLKYLLVHHDHLIPGDVLLELFWPDANPSVGRNRLHQAMHGLRTALSASGATKAGLRIVCREWCYGLPSGTRVWVDSEAFEHLLSIGRHAEQTQQFPQASAAYEAALDLYQGDFLSEDYYADWTQERRLRLDAARLDTFDRLSMLSLAQGDSQAALEYCRQLLGIDRCREDVHQRMMHCYALLGQRTQALRQYEICTQALRKDLDLEPLPETTELYQKISACVPAPYLTLPRRVVGAD